MLKKCLFLSLFLSCRVFAECTVNDIDVELVKVSFVDSCKTKSCPKMKGVGVINNNCDAAIGVQIKAIAYDGKNNPMAVQTMWPASIHDIPPGKYTFSIDYWIEYEEGMKSVGLSVESVKKWDR